MSKQEISIAQVKQIAKEELQKYIQGNFSEENLRKTIQNQLENSGKDIVFKELGLKRDSWSRGTWELNNYGTIVNMVQNSPHIKEIGREIVQEIIKQVTPEEVLSSLNKQNIQSLKKIYRETLFDYFKDEVKNLAIEHGKEQAQKLFNQYLYEENNSEQI